MVLKMNQIEKIESFAHENGVPIMMDGGVELLIEKIKENNCKSFLELGTAIARTTILVASLSKDMRVVTIERNPIMIQEAKKNIEESGLSSQITLIEGDALEVDNPTGEFDCIFIDAAKSQYGKFFEKYSPLLSKHGIIVIDNLNFHGFVDHPENTTNRNTRQLVGKIKRFRDALPNYEGFETEFYNVGDGVAITRRQNEQIG